MNAGIGGATAPATAERALLAHRVEGVAGGEPVVLLNGGLMSLAGWDRIAPAFVARCRLVRCDFRGQLLSPGPPPQSLDGHVADLLALLDALEIARIHLVGTSFGALVAVRFAARHAERAASLSAIAATDRITPEAWAETARMRELARAAAAGGDGGRVLDFLLPRAYTPEYLGAQSAAMRIYRHWVAALPAAWFQGLDGILSVLEGLDLTGDLAAIRCPALVLAAEGDRTFPPERARALAAGIADCRLVLLPGGSHSLVVEQPERVAGIVLELLPSLRAAT